MENFNKSVISKYINYSNIAELATIYLPDTDNDGEFDLCMSESACELVHLMGSDLEVDDVYYDTYPTKVVEEILDYSYPDTGLKYLQEAIVGYFEDVYKKAVDFNN